MGDIVKREELRGKYKGLGIKISGLTKLYTVWVHNLRRSKT